MEITIRKEEVKDYNEIYQLIKTAFETAEVKDGDEQDYAAQLRTKNNFIPDLALVAEKDDKLIGQIMLTETYVTQSNNSVYKALLLSPISVLPQYRSQKVGSRLIEESFNRARVLGYQAIFLCGDPGYYNRFGFRQTSFFGIYPENDIPLQYVLVCELTPDALKDIQGKVTCC